MSGQAEVGVVLIRCRRLHRIERTHLDVPMLYCSQDRIKLRQHVRAIIRDGSDAFLGSQSLRSLELDGRREVGLIVTDPAVVKPMRDTFEADWATTGAARKQKKKEEERAELPNGRTA